MKRYLPAIIVAIVGLAGVLLYRARKPQALTVSQEQAKKGEMKSAHVRGAADTLATLEEFGDFQCRPAARVPSR